MASSSSSNLDLAKSMGKEKTLKPKLFLRRVQLQTLSILSLHLNLSQTLSFYVLAKPCAQALIHRGSFALKTQVWTSGLLFKITFCAANLKEHLCSGKLWRGFPGQSSTFCHPSVIGTINTSSLSSKFVFSLPCSPLPSSELFPEERRGWLKVRSLCARTC